ncbi:5556_t:CDS:1, partial [Acaulospora morrowiae]
EETSYAITPPTLSSLPKLYFLPNSLSKYSDFPFPAEINFILQYHNDQSLKNKLNVEHDLDSFDEEKWKRTLVMKMELIHNDKI